MADDCISVTFEDGRQWDYCWEDGHPDPSWDSDNVVTGLRQGQGDQARKWRTCQYYLKGMSAICNHWTEGSPSDEEGTVTSGSFFCAYVKENTPDNPDEPPAEIPTGFNYAHCDFLGRRHWCSKYEESVPTDFDEWICTAPNPYITGLGEKSTGAEAAIFTPVPRSRIWGYNDANDGTGTGRCDCYGMGRGGAGCAVDSADDFLREQKLSELPIACNFYRPYQMGFGIIDPDGKTKDDIEDDLVTITDQGWERVQAWEDDPTTRLPLNYELYNTLAQFQKCQWWDEDTGRQYIEDGGILHLDGAPDIFDDTGRVEFCKCTDSDAINYNTRIFESATASGGIWEETGAQFALDGVWALGGGPVCNGARPDCPCYSGKWTYLKHEKMLPGMPVTANQILELRFWAQDWDNQEDYNNYYKQAPNFDDPKTEAIYTFTKWHKLTSDAADSKMKGKRLTLCQPAPLHQKEFQEAYIQEEEVDYHQVQIGTSTEGGQRHFPSLIRNPQFYDLKPLVVTYPYFNDDVFDPELCKAPSPAGNIKRHNNIYGDAVKTVGQTIRNKKVYAINTKEIPVDALLKEYSGVFNIKGNKKNTKTLTGLSNDIYNILRETVSRGFKDSPDYIKQATSDATFGYFLIDSVKLKYNQVNSILICVDYGDGTWEYRWRQVVSQWYGGIVKQLESVHEYPDVGSDAPGFTNPQPEEISPPASAEAIIQYIGAGPRAGAQVYSTFSLEDIISGFNYYSYSMQEVTMEEKLESFWGTVGNTNRIWLEISDLNINYVYNWDVASAEFRLITETQEDGSEKPVRNGVPEVVALEKILVDDNHIPPNACLLKPVDDIRIRFLPSEWELYVTYKYEQLTDDQEIIANSANTFIHGANSSELSRYRNSFALEQAGNLISVGDISQSSIQLMVHFPDENNRVISSFATKLLLNIVRESCRSVDIYYRYEAEGRQYRLEPFKGFCIDLKQDFPMPDPYKHVEAPNCGDHEYSIWSYEGPMWFPYNRCRGYDMYDEFTVCNNCQAGYVGPINDGVARDSEGNILYAGGQVIKRNDYRYCGPYKYDAFGDSRGNWVAACDCGCSFWYSDASAATVVFSGYSRKKTTVDLKTYIEQEWTPPPFGNEGRELVEKFISQDFVNHAMPNDPYSRNEWMPMMLDHSVFFSTFNAYDDNPEDEYMDITEYYGLEPFRYTTQLNMVISESINEMAEREELEGDTPGSPTGPVIRYRWEDLFQVHHEGNCSYPFPAYPIGASVTKALFYYLKHDWHAWAWQEGWKDIERNLEGELPETAPGDEDRIIDMGKLDFVELIKPLYIFDAYKAEHRRIMDEGGYVVEYRGPVMDEDGNMEKYPFLTFYGNDESFRRPFEILYPEDEYTNVKVTWATEGGELNVDASSSEDNSYELTKGGEWTHSQDTLFDNTAVLDTEAADAAGRKLVFSVDGFSGDEVYKYYNRGLIANLTRDRLYYLPKKETFLFYSSGGDGITGLFSDLGGEIAISTTSTKEYEKKNIQLIPGSFVWDDSSVTITSISEGKWAFARLHINGNWGYAEGLSEDQKKDEVHELTMPGVSLSYTFEDGSSGSPVGQSTTEYLSPTTDQEPELYDIYLDFLLGPIEMLNKRVTKFNINFTSSPGTFISINEIRLDKAVYIDVRYEYINVWERKYIASTFEDVGGGGINLDGPGDNLHYQEDLYNAGQYVSFRGLKFHDVELVALDKTKTVAAGIRYSEDVAVSDITYDNLHEIEKTEQRALYEYAPNIDPSGDDMFYTGIIPYKYENFLDGLGLQFPLYDLTIVSEKLSWEKHALFKQFKQYDFWRPGGHFYTWNNTFIQQKCMLFGPAENFFEAYYAHVDHVGVGNPLEVDASRPIDPGNVYYSTRFYTQQAKYDRAMILAGGEPEFNDRVSSGVPYNIDTFI